MSSEIAIPENANLPAVPDEDVLGLEDFDSSDEVMPTLRIDHKQGVFVDALSNEEFPSLNVILLGLIKQRVLWEPEVEENSKGPLCRSFNYSIGHPDPERFPWKSAPDFNAASTELPCEVCPLKEWGSHPNRDTPWCSEQHTFALLQPLDDEGTLAPALLTVQRSAIKPSKTYLTSFSRERKPLYTVMTKVTLDHRKRGSVDFAVPKFARSEGTDQELWPHFAQQYRMIREFVQTPRFRQDEEGKAVVASEPVGVAASAPTPGGDDELPF